MRQRLGLAAALLGDPELLILDEPANGLDPEGVRWLRDFLRAFAAGKRTVLISSHVLAEVAQTVDQVLIINRGKLVVESSLEQLTARVGGSVRVRTPEPDRSCRRRSCASGSRPRPCNEHALLVHGTSSERVGDDRVRRRRPDPRARRRRLLARRRLPRAHRGAAAVIAQAQAELLKIRSTRTTVGLVLGMIALILLFSLLSGLLTKAPRPHQHRGPARTAQRRQPRRRLLGARRDHARDQRVPLRHDPPHLPLHAQTLARARRQARRRPARRARLRHRRRRARLRDRLRLPRRPRHPRSRSTAARRRCCCSATLAGVALWGAIGVGIGAIVRNQVGAIIGLLAWGFVVENLLFAFVPSVGRFSPVHAANALIGLTTKHLLPAAAGGAILLAWTVALAIAGIAARRTPRRHLRRLK